MSVGGCLQLLSFEYGSEAGMRSCSITFQYMCGLGIVHSYGSKSLVLFLLMM